MIVGQRFLLNMFNILELTEIYRYVTFAIYRRHFLAKWVLALEYSCCVLYMIFVLHS